MKKILLSGFLFVFFTAQSQEWVEKMQDPNGNFYDVKSAFENYWQGRDNTEKGKGYKAYKRWENFVEKRVYPSGNLSQLNLTAKNFEEFLQTQTSGTHKTLGSGNNLIASATWTAVGPFGPISGSAGGQLLKSGRLNFITIDPTNSNNLWAGAPAGGLWKSTNGGVSWTTNTDFLAVHGCSDLAIDPNNTNVMYLATGDGDAGDTRSVGVLKSTNGGITWNTTGLISPVTTYFIIRRLLINPTNPSIVLAAANTGIYRTTNAGINWTLVSSLNTHDIEFKPGDPNTIYAAGTSFRMSTNGGASFTTITNGITNTGVNRMAIAVTPADPNYVYVLASSSTNSGYYGFYRSVNSGLAFTQSTNTLNLLGWSSLGTDVGGQGWYDLCIAASPLDKDEVVTGGVNVWRTTNGGTSWNIYGHWTGTGAPFTHADHHDLEYSSSGVLFNANDGTLYRRDANAWTEISGNMNISQIYRIGLSALSANRWITGHQDNGTSIWNGTTYNAAIGGDGMDCFYDRTNNSNVFGETQNGGLRKSTNAGSTWVTCTTGLSGTSPWITVWKQDPVNANTLYCGRTNLFVSSNQAGNWAPLTAITGTGTIREFAIAPSNNQVIYVLKSTGIFKTTNGGNSWTNVTGSVPIASALPEFIAIDPNNANNAWLILGGYSNGNKIYKTIDGGTTWSNFSANLPNIPGNCVLFEPGSNSRVYVGMDVGIYYRDNLAPGWTLYNSNLPNVPISELEISPANPGILYAATYGRGVWAASLVSAIAPTSDFLQVPGPACPGSVVTFSDQSNNAPTSWSWSVTPSLGASIVSPTSQVTGIGFASTGIYTVSLQAGNSVGAGNIYSQTISISPPPSISVSVASQTICPGTTVTYTVSGATSYNWSNGGGISSVVTYTPSSATVYTVTGVSNSCSTSVTTSVSITSQPTIVISSANNICSGTAVMLLASGANSYTWSNSSVSPFVSVTPSVTTAYTVTGKGSNGCTSDAVKTIVVIGAPNISISSQDTLICENAPAVLNASGANSYTWLPGGQNAASMIFNPSATTTYTLLGEDSAGCNHSAVHTVTVTDCTSIGNLLSLDKNDFSVFPNPVKGKLSIKSNSNFNQNVKLELLDVTGKLVMNRTLSFSHKNQTIDISSIELAQGTYFLKLSSDKETSSMIRIIKE